MKIPSRLSRRSTLVTLLLTGAAALAAALPQDDRPPDSLLYPRTIVLVRHAEKSADDPRDLRHCLSEIEEPSATCSETASTDSA